MSQRLFGFRHARIRRRGVRALSVLAAAAICVCANAALPQRASMGVSAVVLPSCRFSSANAMPDSRAGGGAAGGANSQLVSSSCNTAMPAQAYVRESAPADANPALPPAPPSAATSRRTLTESRLVQYVLDY